MEGLHGTEKHEEGLQNVKMTPMLLSGKKWGCFGTQGTKKSN